MKVLRFTAINALLLSALVGLTHCKSAEKGGALSETEQGSDLTRKDAIERSRQISEVSYELEVQLNAKSDFFSGKSLISFQIKDAGSPVRVDFSEGEIQALKINGVEQPLELKRPYWIHLPSESLKVGANTVEVAYTHKYSRMGQGLHRFEDPETKDVFLYTQFEVNDAQRFMPCFDQPDLRATLELTVVAPKNWQVVSTTRESKVQSKNKNEKIWTFQKTAKIATYLFSLHAGPYKVWKDKFGDLELRLYARPSLARYIQPAEWFTITKQGFKFFNDFFAYPYPFGKYDQLIVPEFNAGAMENVGAVTFSERYVKRSQKTRDQRRGLAATILHEMAHMWFGNIVTMKWWNDLWLNESFASYLAAKSMFEATEFKEVWQEFFSREKGWAYWSDGLSTTHPIEADIPSVKAAFANFDGITYGKGASVLKQLQAYVGERGFKQGMQLYIRQHAFGNTELKDFVGALQKFTEKDLTTWSERWLKQSGADRLTTKWECKDEKLEKITLIDTPTKGARFRPQTVSVGLYNVAKNGRIERAELIEADLTSNTNEIKGSWSCPDMVYPNALDQGYAEVSLDSRTLALVKAKLSSLNDDLVRTMLWADLWHMVRETELPLKYYVSILKQHLPKENDAILLRMVARTLDRTLEYWPKQAKAERSSFVAWLESHLINRIKSARAGSDAQKFWADTFIDLAETSSGLEVLDKWLSNGQINSRFKIDLDRRWDIVRKFARHGHKSLNVELAKAKKLDRSDRGTREALSVEAIQPDLAIKRKWVDVLKEPTPSVSLAEARAVLGSLFPYEQGDLAERFSSDFFAYVKANGQSENPELVTSVASGLNPLNCTENQSKQVKSFFAKEQSLEPSLKKSIQMQIDEDERCQRIRSMSLL